MMSTLRRPLRRRRDAGRGALLLDFALMLPLIVWFLAFVLNISHAVLLQSALQAAVDQAVRAGAQQGGVVVGDEDISQQAFDDGLDQIVGDVHPTDEPELQVLSSPVCGSELVLRGVLPAEPLFPGMGFLLFMLDPDEDGERTPDWRLTATSVARCEIVR